jgi:sigma-B regulation protein RsbU (phosphoserine phosphatase)
MSTNFISVSPTGFSPAVSTRFEDEPRWTAPQAAVHAALTLQFAADMYKLLDCTWIVAMNADRGALHPVAVFGTHPGHEIAGAIPAANEPAPCATCSLLVHGRTAGVLALGPKRNSPRYTASDLNLLTEAAAHIGSLLENERLSWHLAANILEAERTRRELETAREVQNRFFPTRFSAVQGIDYYGECEPCSEVGGDFFDFTPLPGNGLAIAIGDVSGHGVPAAIIMAALQAALRSISARNAARPAQIVAELNGLVCDLCPDNFYATLLYARIDPEKGSLTYVNAGHEPALLLRSDARRLYRLNVGGTVLGLSRQSAYQQAAIPLHGGDTLVAFTDGITETANACGEEHGADRIAGYLRAHPEIAARDLVAEIMRGADDFRGRSARIDDRTAVAARIRKSEEQAPLFAVAPWERERIHETVAA